MDPISFLEFGGNGVLLAIVLAAFKALEKSSDTKAAKKNGSISSRIESIEKGLETLTNEFRSFRQEVTDRQFKEDIIKEISNEQ